MNNSTTVPATPMRRLRLAAAIAMLAGSALGGCATPGSSTSVSIPSPSAAAVRTAKPTTARTAEPTAAPSRIATFDGTFAVDPDGRSLALACWGTGSPTVILETGGANLEQWRGSRMVFQLSHRTRVCSYDRAGTGASDPAPNERRDAEDVVNDLHALLGAARIEGPYVLLGRSFGSMIVAHYAEALPDGILGVVLLDAPAPSATFTASSEPAGVWDYPGNTEHLDVVGGFENRFANDPPMFDAPLLLITPVEGEGSVANDRFWLQSSPRSRQEELRCDGHPTDPCVDEVLQVVEDVGS